MPAGRRRRKEVDEVLVQVTAHGGQRDRAGSEGFGQAVDTDGDQAMARSKRSRVRRHPRRLRFGQLG